MNAKSSANTMPLVREHKRERAGENILFNARTRSKVAKQGGDALSDLAQRDVDRTGRYPAPAELGTGGELVPAEPDLRDTVKNPDYVTVDASRAPQRRTSLCRARHSRCSVRSRAFEQPVALN